MEKRKVKVGVLGAGRGGSMIRYCELAENAELVAICDKWEPSLEPHKGKGIALYTDFDEFLKNEEMEAVVLANYANEHAPFAIKCFNAGKHVFSEVLPFQNLKEGVELVEAIEKSGLVYSYGENYCYMGPTQEMRRLYRDGSVGTFEYGECEYMHNCEYHWEQITRADPNHWRNNMTATFYCTHSIGPMIHILGKRPVQVVGFEAPFNSRMKRMGAKAGPMAMEVITFEDGTFIKSIHGVGCPKFSYWFNIQGSKGNMETAREITGYRTFDTLYTEIDAFEGEHLDGDDKRIRRYEPTGSNPEMEAKFGHAGGDFYTMYYFCEKILGDENAEIIDIYEACDMFLPGLFAYKSIMAGNMPMKLPDFRKKEDRDLWRNDTSCTDPKAAGDMLIPSYSKGNPDIPDSVYERLKDMMENPVD